jgi:hypothetical protein
MKCKYKKGYETLNYRRFISCNQGDLDPEVLKKMREHYGLSQLILHDIEPEDCIELIEHPEQPVFLRKMPLGTILKVVKIEHTMVTCMNLQFWPDGARYTFRLDWLRWFKRVLRQ